MIACAPTFGRANRIAARGGFMDRRNGWRCAERRTVMRSSSEVISSARGVFMRAPYQGDVVDFHGVIPPWASATLAVPASIGTGSDSACWPMALHEWLRPLPGGGVGGRSHAMDPIPTGNGAPRQSPGGAASPGIGMARLQR